jgi:pentatricopeptide repeat protein
VGKSFDPTAGIDSVPTSQVTRIRPIVQSLTDRGVFADHRIFALRIRQEAVIKGDMKAAKKVFQIMLDRGLHPNEYHYAALMEGYAATGDLAAAETVMNTAEGGGTRPNCVMHTILIVGYARRKNPNRAMRVLQHMVATGVRPDVPVIDAITSVFFAVGAYRLARQTLLSLWPSVAPLPRDFERVSLKMLVFHLRNLYNGHISSKKLSDRERRKLIDKLEVLSRTWVLTEKARTDSRRTPNREHDVY